ncbi:MAG: tetratricopeptide repeat protein [Terriglobia bacterium]
MPEASGRATGLSRSAAARRALLPFVLLVSTLSLASARGQSPAARASQIQTHLERAQAALKSNRANVAAQELRAVLSLDPRNSEAYSNLGVIAFFQGDCTAASDNFRRALAISPEMIRTKALLGICDMRAGNPSGRALLESSFSELKDKKLRVAVGLQLEEIYYREGDLDQASSLARTLVAIDPDNVNVLYAAQRVYSDLASETLNKLALLAPGSARMQEAIAEHLVNAGNLRAAVVHYRKALAIDPRLSGVHFELGEAILESATSDPKARREAEQEFGTAERLEGDNAQIECELGRLAGLRPDLQAALAHYERAVAMSSGNADAQLGLGEVLLTLARPEQALEHLRIAARSDPLNSAAHYRLAIAYRSLGRTAEAQKEMRLFEQIKTSTEGVRRLYREIGQQVKLPGDQSPKARR